MRVTGARGQAGGQKHKAGHSNGTTVIAVAVVQSTSDVPGPVQSASSFHCVLAISLGALGVTLFLLPMRKSALKPQVYSTPDPGF